MKAKKVLERLGVTRKTLNNYVHSGKIRVLRLENGFYEYDDEDVAALEKNTVKRNIVVIRHGNGVTEFEFRPEQLAELIKTVSDFLKA